MYHVWYDGVWTLDNLCHGRLVWDRIKRRSYMMMAYGLASVKAHRQVSTLSWWYNRGQGKVLAYFVISLVYRDCKLIDCTCLIISHNIFSGNLDDYKTQNSFHGIVPTIVMMMMVNIINLINIGVRVLSFCQLLASWLTDRLHKAYRTGHALMMQHELKKKKRFVVLSRLNWTSAM